MSPHQERSMASDPAPASVVKEEAAESRRTAGQAAISGIWKCPDCGGQVQIIVAPETALNQPFICMCGAPMVPGEERKTDEGGQG
jgi:hypothetical protein